ncbi:conserved membrane protein of unknown function [Candidatus Nitrosocosmicus arcticus]|uniref:Uncharacterized protein n=1 Tax=Candidatus Nitrosocosmicus arcticus TaxID=2035267 RepID=A0A557SV30_9ARCH|nr:conserved membrane protein of unknown function [Candidatus Nitrosocosmicus arcticus]
MFSSDKVLFFKYVIFLGLTYHLNYHPPLIRIFGRFQPSKIWFLVFGFIFFLFIVCSCYPFGNEQLAFAHSFFGGNDAGFNGTQTQSIGNYVVELLVNPSKPMIGKDTTFLFRLTSSAGDELIELPVSFYIFKDGKPVFSNPNNFTIVRQGHYDFDYIFSEPGKYLLFVDIKDIFYTLNILNFVFEVNVEVPIAERIYDLLQIFMVNYYYIYIPLAALIGISFIVKLRGRKDVKRVSE